MMEPNSFHQHRSSPYLMKALDSINTDDQHQKNNNNVSLYKRKFKINHLEDQSQDRSSLLNIGGGAGNYNRPINGNPRKLRLGYHKYFEDYNQEQLQHSIHDGKKVPGFNIQQSPRPQTNLHKQSKDKNTIFVLNGPQLIQLERQNDDLSNSVEVNNTVRNSMWEKHDTHSIIFENQSKLLLESPLRRDLRNDNPNEMPSYLLKDLQDQFRGEADFKDLIDQEDEIEFLIQEIDRHISSVNATRASPDSEMRSQTALGRFSDQHEQRRKTHEPLITVKSVQIDLSTNNISRSKTRFGQTKISNNSSQSKLSTKSQDQETLISQLIKSQVLKKELDFNAYLDKYASQYVDLANRGEIENDFKILESKVYKKPSNSKTLIERYMILHQNKMQCFSFPKTDFQQPLLTIRIENIKSIETLLPESSQNQVQNTLNRKFETLFSKSKLSPSQSFSQNNKNQPKHFFFKITLDTPLKGSFQSQSLKKTAITDRIVNDQNDLFGVINDDMILKPLPSPINQSENKTPKIRDSYKELPQNNSNYYDTVILDNIEDQQSFLFQEEDEESQTTFLRMSQTLKQMQQSKNKGHNSQKTDYYEVFEIGCDSEAMCRKWVLVIKWLIKKHLMSIK
eukprot:403356324